MKKSTKAHLSQQLLDISLLSPLIATTRLARLSTRSPLSAASDLTAMAIEKASIFSEAWMRMSGSAATALFDPWGILSTKRSAAQSSMAMLSSALRPVHARVKRNASSLNRR